MTASVTIRCARCGGNAAEFALLPPDAGSSQRGLRRDGFMGQVTKFGTIDQLRDLLELIRLADFASAARADQDFVGFHCRKCASSYCERCWRIGPPEFDEGFYDCTRATCPAGHDQVVDD